MTKHAFRAAERQAIYRVIAERRDMRRFVPDAVVPKASAWDGCRSSSPAGWLRCSGCPTTQRPSRSCVLARFPEFPDRPALESDQWTFGRPLAEFVSENGWATPTAPIR